MSGIEDRWELAELVAVMWSADMAARFPNASHVFCRAVHNHQGEFIKCYGWHCNRCGVPTNMYGHHDCPDRP